MGATDNNRKLGFLFAAIFAYVALHPAIGPGLAFEAVGIRIWSAVLSVGFALPAWLAPERLAPLTRAWMALGKLMHHVVNPLVLGSIFFLVLTPLAILRRLLGSPGMPLRYEPQLESYWIERKPPGPDPKTLTRQF